MSEYCSTCGPAKWWERSDEAKKIAILKAKEYAKEKQISVAVWEGESGWAYGEAFAAYANGRPVATVVSQYK